jgi:uncharacterized protein (TIGR03435 family)
MAKLMRWIIAVGLLAQGGALSGQSLAGTWQGTLQAPRAPNGGFRTVIQVSTTDANGLKATFYNLDQSGGSGDDATTITLQGSTVKMSIVAIGASYEGKLSADGNSITGTFTRGLAPVPLNLTRATPQTAWTIPEPPPPVKQMAADANAEFELATIKPTQDGTGFSIRPTPSGMLIATGASLGYLIRFAYEVHPRQITNEPDWVETERYDLTAKPNKGGQPSLKQMRVMVGKLLADRFQLAFHFEKKEIPAYAVIVAKGGAKLSVNDANLNGNPGYNRGPGGVAVTNSTIPEFINFILSNAVDRPVVDQTGFGSIRYNFGLKWTPEGSLSGAGGRAASLGGDDAPPDIFAAMQQQLGLKLQPTRAEVEVLAIDKVERPSAN